MNLFLKRALFLLALLLLCFPLAQSVRNLVHEPPLKGYFRLQEKPGPTYFTWRRWFSGEFQTYWSKGTEDHIGFRNSLVRVNNEVDYRLFSILHAEGFIEGKKGMLFEEAYILEYNGRFFIGRKTIDFKLAKFKWLQEELKKNGTDLVLFLEPGKASFYPEYIPDRYHPRNHTRTNLEYYLQRIREQQINMLDLNSWFCQIKDTSRYPLFPRYGMHWSLYGACLAADTLAKYIGTLRHIEMPAMHIASVTVSDSLQWTDKDIGDLLNLACPLPRVQAAYPEVTYSGPSRDQLPKVLTIGDSYYVNIVAKYSDHLFGTNDYWYYFSKVWPRIDETDNPEYLDKSDLARKLKSYQVILVAVSEINLHCGFWNFIDEAYEALRPGYRDTWVYRYENNIRNIESWFRYMTVKARANHTTLEEIIHRDAEYLVYNDFQKLEGKTHEDSLFYEERSRKMNR